MSDFRTLSPTMLAAPQIQPADLADAQAKDVKLVINNRPDGEDPAAPQSAEIEAAARELGMDYLYLPVTPGGIEADQVDALRGALEASRGTALAYCRSGTRSTFLWALAQAKGGATPDDIARAAARAGYDIGPVRPMMDTFAAR